MKALRYFAAAALAAASLSSQAAGLLIDDFSTAQAEVSDSTTNGSNFGGAGVWSQTCGGGIIGGCRELYVERTGGSATGSRDVAADVSGGSFNVSAGSQVQGFGIIRWDGAGTGTLATPNMGLGNQNFAAAADRFRIEVIFSDVGLPNPTLTFQIGVFTAAGQYTTLDIPGPAFGGPGVLNFDITFTQLMFLGTSVGGGVDLTNVNALQAIVNVDNAQTAFDVSINLVTTSMPEPTPLALLGLSLLGLVALRRRAKKSA